MNIKELLDNKFVVTCLAVGLLFTAIVIIAGAIFGKDVAGSVAGLLAAVALPIFTKVRRLSFSSRLINEHEVAISFAKTNFYNIFLSVFSFFGVANLLCILYFGLLALFKVDLKINSIEDFLDNTFIGVSLVSITLVSFFITGFVYAKTSVNTNYLGATIGAVMIIIINTFTSLIIIFGLSVDLGDNRQPFLQLLPFFLFWGAYIGLMLLGAYLGFRNRHFVIQENHVITPTS